MRAAGCQALFSLPWLRQSSALEMVSRSPVARDEIHDSAFAETRERASERKTNSLDQLALAVYDVVHQLSSLGQRRRAWENPEVAIAIRHCGANLNRCLVVEDGPGAKEIGERRYRCARRGTASSQ